MLKKLRSTQLKRNLAVIYDILSRNIYELNLQYLNQNQFIQCIYFLFQQSHSLIYTIFVNVEVLGSNEMLLASIRVVKKQTIWNKGIYTIVVCSPNCWGYW